MENLKEYYTGLFEKYGYNEKSLGWSKNKQNIRFCQLLRFFDVKEGDSILDVGCGFGDMRRYIVDTYPFHTSYTGLDVMDSFLEIAKDQNGQYAGTEFVSCDFLEYRGKQAEVSDKRNRRTPTLLDENKYNYVCGSGIFGYRIYDDEGMYHHIETVMNKALSLADGGVAFDFLSNQVDYHSGETDFHASPERVLELAYRYTRRVILDNSAMPFEFSVVLFPNQDFDKSTTVFSDYEETT